MNFVGWASISHKDSGPDVQQHSRTYGHPPGTADEEISMSRKTDRKARSRKLAKEQSLTELEQAIGEREQLAGDRDQARIDLEQVDQDEQRQESTAPDQRVATILDDRQARIDREQVIRDVNQEALDHAQEGRDNQQEALDETRAVINLPASQQPRTADPSSVHQGAIDRAQAADTRAQALGPAIES
jgi:hypothetical protein